MRSFVFGDSPAPRAHSGAVAVPLRRVAWALGLLGSVLACGSDDEGAETTALADSGNLAPLTSNTLDIPTTVAVRDGVAWVAESQFDHYAPFGGTGDATPFRLIGVPLAGGATAAQTIPLPENFFPEGVAASAGGRLYVGSVADGSIYTVAPNALVAEVFVAKGVLSKPSVLGMTVSNVGDILWVCNTVTSPAAGQLPSADIVGIGAQDRTIKAVHPLPSSSAGAFCNDLVMAPNGNLWASESFGGRLFRINAAELLGNGPATEWMQSSALTGPNGPAVNSFGVNGLTLVSGKLFFVNSSGGSLLSIDPTLAQPSTSDVSVVALTENNVTGPVVLGNPDGITRLSDTELLLVESGFCNPACGGKRLTRVAFDTN
jgi:streptogramin lyase